MAAAREQAVRARRPDAEEALGQAKHDAVQRKQAETNPVETKTVDTKTAAPKADLGAETPLELPPAPPASAPAGAKPQAAPAAPPKSGKRKRVLAGIGLLLALAAAGYATHYIMVGRFMVSTDDSYVRANNTMLGARVSGHIQEIVPRDNSVVHKGDVIFRIDDGDYKIAVDAARTKIATQEATIARIGRQVAAQQSAVEQAQANLTSSEAAMKRAGLDYERQQALSSKGFASHATFEQSEAARDQGQAAVRAAQAAFDAARDNVEVTKAQQAEAQAQLAELKTSLAKAERDLEFAIVRAPVDGTFSNRLVSTGDFVAVGQRLGNVVPLDDVFIDANYKETQLKRIRPGQPVTIKVDAYGARGFKGVVDSISPAAGSVFTLLPPDNATGNFTKIVQRLPVRIRVPKEVARQNLLRAGMSVYVTVDTTDGAKDADSDTDLDAPATVQGK
ncbi:putative multidrug resistance protein A (drug efflux transporter, EmrA-like) [Bradyrhizobium sp. ORS 278]|uniref:HlyD family secretion protein n=1 Tax=Bradyrhizobium sp. (strain ORS 278) TaxID=114615 RepID=UPI0001507F98|nr:HlyD family secretion protein [Bradyrhizobium sp. ORS 278]CAL79343.1 putative multidrug resistance protein A (drug efflux transporter, EmrA-like) [Bradyrhizobium sp. ORS 278]